MINIIVPSRHHVSTVVLTLFLFAVFSLLLSIVFLFKAHNFSLRYDEIKTRVHNYNEKIELLDINTLDLSAFTHFHESLTSLSDIHGVSINVLQTLDLISSLTPDMLHLNRFSYERHKNQVMVSAVSDDAKQLQKFVARLEGSQYLKDVLILRKSRLDAEEAAQEYIIQFNL